MNMNKDDAVTKIAQHIEVITTDTTDLKETAFGSVETCRSVYDVLKHRYKHVHLNVVQTEQDLQRIVNLAPDLVVLCVKYIIEEEQGAMIWLSDYFSRHEVPFTGSDRATLEFDSNKGKAKNALLRKGVATAEFFLAHPGLYTDESDLPLPLPLFVKPLDAANGNGIDENSLVHDFFSYEAKIAEIYAVYGGSALVEEVLPGREFTVAVFDEPAHNSRLIYPVEVIVPRNSKGDRVLGCLEKSNNQEVLLQVAEPTRTAISELAGKVFSALEVRDFGRIDIKMDAHGNPHFIEANLVPGMTPGTSYFPRACNINGMMSYASVVLKIVKIALRRSELPAFVPGLAAVQSLPSILGETHE